MGRGVLDEPFVIEWIGACPDIPFQNPFPAGPFCPCPVCPPKETARSQVNPPEPADAPAAPHARTDS